MKTISSETVYKGKIFDVRSDSISDGGVEYERDVVVHNGSCVILPIFADGTIGLVRQYRHAAGKYLLELAAGTLEPGEDPLEGAKRELEEELGVTAAKWEKLCEFYVSPGFLTEKMHLFLASEITETAQKLEDDEILTVEHHSLAALIQMIEKGEIEDAKTIIGLLNVANRGDDLI